MLPRLQELWNAQMRHRESHQTGLRFGTDSRCTLIAYLSACSGSGAGKGRNRGRMIVSLHLDRDVDRLVMGAIDPGVRIRKPSCRSRTLDDRGIVTIGRKHSERGVGVGISNHREQRMRLLLAIDHELRVENLVPTVLGIGLREHHQLNVGGIARKLAEGIEQIVDLIIRQCQSEAAIRLLQCLRSMLNTMDCNSLGRSTANSSAA